ncbi:hypothetical protein E2320_011843 [Naja naja]|nr:hypothetical protein E2320_011843 [Naja naja]
MTHVLYLPRDWFMFCGAYAYAFIPPNAIGGPCTNGRLMTIMATAHAKNINKNTKLYYEVINSSLYHDLRFYREPVPDDTVVREEHEPHIIIYTYPTLRWPVAHWGAEHESIGEHVKKHRGKRSDLSDAYSSDCDDEVVVLSKVEAALADEMGEIRKSVLQYRVAFDYILLIYITDVRN